MGGVSRFRQIARDIPVDGVLAELDARPELWGRNVERLVKHGPHRETEDIWVRYRDPAELTGPSSFAEPHFSVWYPAWRALPSLEPIVFGLAATVRAVHIGGILLTRIPAGRNVYPHDDRGTWHSEYHNAKVWLPLRANDRCFNVSAGEWVKMAVGSAWHFDNLIEHSVHNRGDTERIALICCFRSE